MSVLTRLTVRRDALFWLLQCGGWIGFGVAMWVWGLELWPPADALVNKLLLAGTGFALTLGFRWLYRRARARVLPPLPFAALIAAASLGGAALWREAHGLLLVAYHAASAASAPSAPIRFPLAIAIGTLLYDSLVLLAWSLFYWGINAWIELDDQRARANRAEALAHQARLQALRSQLEPHFLFNTLNAISTLVAEGDNAAAVRMISRLGDFLRLTLESADEAEVSVAEELEFVERYLEIEQVRFGDRLRVTIEASPEAMGGLVPALVLQPLVENAVRHGVLARESGGHIALTIAREDGILRMSVHDDGPGLAPRRVEDAAEDPAEDTDGAARRGVGLANTAARLAELYAERSRLSLDSPPEGGFSATIRIPFHLASSRLYEAGSEPPAGSARGRAG